MGGRRFFVRRPLSACHVSALILHVPPRELVFSRMESWANSHGWVARNHVEHPMTSAQRSTLTRTQFSTHELADEQSDFAPQILKFPSVWKPDRAQDAESCARPPKPRRRHIPDPAQETLWPSRIDPDVLAYAESTKEELAAQIVPEDQRAWVRQNLSLRDYYGDWMLPELERRVQKGSLAKGTLAKDRQALRRWEEATRPENWDPNKNWPGLPIGYITPRAVQQFLENLFEISTSTATAKSTWNHVRNILNHAVKMRAIDTFPKPEHIPNPTPSDDDEMVTFYRPEQIEAAYGAFKDHVDLQVALVLAANAGPRSHDVFAMKWSCVDLKGVRPAVTFVAKKTGKRQKVPLAPVTVAQLKRLSSLGSHEYLFPGLSNPLAEDPERSRPARRRRELIRTLLLSVGIDFQRPFQALRATCNKRLEDWRTGVGQFVLGHALTLNARHYYEPSDLIIQAVNSIEQPACFFQI